MSIKGNLGPLWGKEIRGLSTPDGHPNDVFLDSLQSPLTEAENNLYQAKLESFLDTADGDWLEYWGSWLGLHRLNGWGDDHYRQALKDHVLHGRNTISALRQEIASFLKTNLENVYIYEPYRDMFIWNSSYWNTYKFYPSTYYRYAVIDVQLDAPYNKVANEIINLFRPAGVMWVITSLVNVLNADAPIIDFSVDTRGFHFITEYLEYAGFIKRNNHYITPNISKNWHIDNPFIYNDSLLNGGKKYYELSRPIDGVSFFGKPTNEDGDPQKQWDYLTAATSVDPLSVMESNQLSNVDGLGVDFRFRDTYTSYNLFESSNNGGVNVIGKTSVGVPLMVEQVFYSEGEIGYKIKIPQAEISRLFQGQSLSNLYLGFLVKTDGIDKPNNSYLISLDVRGTNALFYKFGNESHDITGNSGDLYSSTWKRLYNVYEASDNIKYTYVYAKINDPSKDFVLEIKKPKLVAYSGVEPTKEEIAWSPSKKESTRTTLRGVIDFYNYFLTDTSSGSDKVEDVLGHIDQSPIKNINLRLKQDSINPVEVNAYAFDFSLGIWVLQDTLSVTQTYKTYHLPFVTLKPYLNNNGLFFIKLVPGNLITTLSVDYYGFSYGNVEHGITECFMPSQDGYGVWLQKIDVPTKDLTLPHLDTATINRAKLNTLQGIKTILYKDSVPMNQLISLGTINPTMATDEFFIDFDYTYENSSSDIILVEIQSVRTGNTNYIKLDTTGSNKGHLHHTITNIEGLSNVFVYSASEGIITNFNISKLSQVYDDTGKNLLENSWNAQCINSAVAGHIEDANNEGESIYVATYNNDQNIVAYIKVPQEYKQGTAFSISIKGLGKITSIQANDKVNLVDYSLNPNYYLRVEYPFNKIIGTNGNPPVIKLELSGASGHPVSFKLPKLEYGSTSTPYAK